METLTRDSGDTRLWLAWVRTPAVDPRRGRVLLQKYGGIRELFAAAGSGDLPEPARRYLEAPDWEGVERDREWLEGRGRMLLTLDDPGYPPQLLEIPDPPSVLFVAGRAETLAQPQVAVVGSRSATPAASQIAHDLARELATAGLVITSGLAVGVDAASHRGALAGDGYTSAVLGCGADRVYPLQHEDLGRQIRENAGALVSEFPTGVAPLPHHFPRRNRIISGLAMGVLVVEAAERSGSLITARYAMEQGREVFAVPGSVHNRLARGCHALIRQGAKLVETVEDILEEIGPQLPAAVSCGPSGQRVPQSMPSQEGYAGLLAHIDYDATSIDLLVERTRLTPQVVSSMLLQLELGGYVSSIPGGRYARITRNPK